MPIEKFEALLPLRIVSRLCHNIIHSTPTLWTFIDSAMGPRAVKVALSKSTRSPIDVKWSDWNSIKLIAPHYNRLRSFRATVTSQKDITPDFKKLFKRLLPHLEEFTLFVANNSFIVLDKLFLCEANCLRRLHIVSCYISWDDTTCLSGLTHLSITAIDQISQRIANFEICEVLISCPQLEELRVLGGRDLGDLDGLEEEVETWNISLPSLRSIELIELSHSMTGTLLSSIKPSTKLNRLICQWSTDSESDLEQLFRRLGDDTLFPFITESCKSAHVTLTDSGIFILTALDSKSKLYCSLEISDIDDAAPLFKGPMYAAVLSSVEHLTIEGHRLCEEGEPYWTELFEYSISASRLTLLHCGSVDPILEILTVPERSSITGPQDEFRCFALEKLELISAEVSDSALLKFVEIRSEHCQSSLLSLKMSQCRGLESKDVIDSIGNFLEKENFIWDGLGLSPSPLKDSESSGALVERSQQRG
ncbi:hypothetical protein FRC03_005337 [Tulasnella sp. 419]|nr:hypothetical protein FRC03_005337 [Tulasnella sp. 419]